MKSPKVSMLTVYLSGPMTGLDDFGYPLFRAEAARLRGLGYTVIDPSENFDGATDRKREEYMRADIEHVLAAEAVAVMPGWERSAGSRLEVDIARELGLPVYVAATMTPLVTGDPRFHALLGEIAALHDRKQSDYGSSADAFANVRASEEFGVAAWVGALIRLNDKITRLKSLIAKGFLANESADDSLMDISVYALIALILKRERSSSTLAER